MRVSIFTTSVSTLTGASVYFQHMFSDRWQDQPQETLFLDRDPQPFAILLGYMRSGSLELPEADLSLSRRVLLEAEYLGCERLLVEVKATAMRNSRPDSSNDVIPSPSDDAEAAAEFDAKYGSLQQALRERVLRALWRRPARRPAVLHFCPPTAVKIGSARGRPELLPLPAADGFTDRAARRPGPSADRPRLLPRRLHHGSVELRDGARDEAFGEMTTWLEFSENVDSRSSFPSRACSVLLEGRH